MRKGWLALCCMACMLTCEAAAAESQLPDDIASLELPADEGWDVDLDGKGGQEEVRWTQREEETGIELTVTGEDKTEAKWSVYCWQVQVWIMDLDGKDGAEICISGDVMSDDDVTWCLSYQEGELRLLLYEGETFAPGRIVGADEEGLILSGYVDVLGTLAGAYHLMAEDGALVQAGDGLWHFDYDLQSEVTWNQRALTAKTNIPVTYLDLTGKESQGELAKGERIMITASDCASRAWFILQDGRRGYFTIEPDEAAGWGYLVGGVGEQTLFEGIRYVG